MKSGMTELMTVIVFTDLDGTLLNHDNYNYQAALPVIEELKKKGIPVIPVTSKTRQEVETLIHELGIEDPFVVENGSGIFVPLNYKKLYKDFDIPTGKIYGDYALKSLGCTYEDARNGLRKLEQKLNVELKGFGDLSEDEVQQLTGLPLSDVKEAKAREFTEPFVLPEGIEPNDIEEAATEIGFRVLVGGRFCHLLSREAGKGKAVNWLLKQYQSIYLDKEITTIGLGDSPNDIELLQAVQYAVIIPGKMGKPNPKLVEKGLGRWIISHAPAPEGWASSVQDILLRQLQSPLIQ